MFIMHAYVNHSHRYKCYISYNGFWEKLNRGRGDLTVVENLFASRRSQVQPSAAVL